jgi:hypothetical protein
MIAKARRAIESHPFPRLTSSSSPRVDPLSFARANAALRAQHEFEPTPTLPLGACHFLFAARSQSGMLWVLNEARLRAAHAAARVHHASRRHGGGMAALRACAAGSEALPRRLVVCRGASQRHGRARSGRSRQQSLRAWLTRPGIYRGAEPGARACLRRGS